MTTTQLRLIKGEETTGSRTAPTRTLSSAPSLSVVPPLLSVMKQPTRPTLDEIVRGVECGEFCDWCWTWMEDGVCDCP